MVDFERLYNEKKSLGWTVPTEYGEFALLFPSDTANLPEELIKENGEPMSFGAAYPAGFRDGSVKGRSYVFMPEKMDGMITAPKLVYHDVEARTGSHERASRVAFRLAESLGDEVLERYTRDWLDSNAEALVKASPEQKRFLYELPLLTRQILEERSFI